MGKTKNKRFLRSARSRPTGLQSVKESEAELLTTICNSSVQNLIDKLSSPSDDERECSCTTIANLVVQPSAIFTLLQHNIVKVLAPLILDHSLQVRVKALGALRNLSVDGGEDVCLEMVRKDVLTPLVGLFEQYGQGWSPEKLPGKRFANIKSEIFTEAVHLLWNLCESSEEAMNVFNKECLIDKLWPCLQHAIYGFSVSTTVAQCLHTVTEDNPQASKSYENPELIGLLQSLLIQSPDSSDMVLLRTLASGIMLNICSGHFASTPSNVASTVLSAVSDVLTLDASAMLHAAVTMEASKITVNGDVNSHRSILEGKTEDPVNVKTQEVKTILSAQQVALEIMTNLCCSGDEEWEDMDSSESSCDEVVDDVSMDTDNTTEDQSTMSPLVMSVEMQEAIKQQGIFEKVLLKVKFDDVYKNCETLKNIHLCKRFERLQEHALLCLNNLVSSLDQVILGGLTRLHEVWLGLVQLSTSKDALQRVSLLEAVTSAIRAVVEKLAELQSEKLRSLEPGDMQYLFEMAQQCQTKEVRVHAIRTVSTIGVLFSKDPEPKPLLKDIGLFLLEVSCKDTELWVVAEALDCIFDVFGEDHLDSLDKEIRLTERLKQLVPMLKSKINATKKNMDEHYPVISTARSNLIRFIKYKSNIQKI